MNFVSCGWLWLYFGALLMFLELLAPGFVLFFFGLSACTVGILRFIFSECFTLAWQLAAFSVLSLVYLLLLRTWVKGVFTGLSTTSNTDFGNESVGSVGTVTNAIVPPKTGRVLIGDAEWTAAATEPIAAGVAVRVVSQSNLTKNVEKLK